MGNHLFCCPHCRHHGKRESQRHVNGCGASRNRLRWLRQWAFDSVAPNCGDEVEARLMLDWLSHRASKLVEQQWPQIHKVAFALLEHGKLGDAEICDLLGGNGRNGNGER
jgi:hypothetical protein